MSCITRASPRANSTRFAASLAVIPLDCCASGFNAGPRLWKSNGRRAPRLSVSHSTASWPLRYLIEHDVLRGPDWSLAGKLDTVISSVAGAPSPGCGKRLTALFAAALHRDWNAALFAPNSPVEALFEQDALTTPLLREFVLLSRAKFTIPTILESFNFGDASEKARVRRFPRRECRAAGLPRPTDLRHNRRSPHRTRRRGRRVSRDLSLVESLLEVYDRLESEFDASSNTRPEGSKDLDLFGWSEIDSKRPKPSPMACVTPSKRGW